MKTIDFIKQYKSQKHNFLTYARYIFFNNMVLGGMKDREHDRAAGVTNFATTVDETAIKAAGTVLKLMIWFVALMLLVQFTSEPIYYIALLGLIGVQALQMVSLKEKMDRATSLKIMAAHEISTYALFPLILSTVMGPSAIIFLAIPLIFVVPFNRLLWGTTIRPKI